MKSRHTEVKRTVEEAMKVYLVEKKQALDNINATKLANVGPTLMNNWTNNEVKDLTAQWQIGYLKMADL